MIGNLEPVPEVHMHVEENGVGSDALFLVVTHSDTVALQYYFFPSFFLRLRGKVYKSMKKKYGQ